MHATILALLAAALVRAAPLPGPNELGERISALPPLHKLPVPIDDLPASADLKRRQLQGSPLSGVEHELTGVLGGGALGGGLKERDGENVDHHRGHHGDDHHHRGHHGRRGGGEGDISLSGAGVSDLPILGGGDDEGGLVTRQLHVGDGFEGAEGEVLNVLPQLEKGLSSGMKERRGKESNGSKGAEGSESSGGSGGLPLVGGLTGLLGGGLKERQLSGLGEASKKGSEGSGGLPLVGGLTGLLGGGLKGRRQLSGLGEGSNKGSKGSGGLPLIGDLTGLLGGGLKERQVSGLPLGSVEKELTGVLGGGL